MKKYFLILFLVSSISSEINVGLSFSLDVWRIRFHVEPGCHYGGEKCTVINVIIPKEQNSIILKDINKQTMQIYDHGFYAGPYPNSYLELIPWNDNEALKVYFRGCDFKEAVLKISKSDYKIILSQEASNYLSEVYRKYGISFYSKRTLELIKNKQQENINKIKPYLDHLNQFNKNVLETIQNPSKHPNENKNEIIKAKIDSLYSFARNNNLMVQWDSIKTIFNLIPIEIKNQNNYEDYFDSEDNKDK
jgi:hypothetical protein